MDNIWTNKANTKFTQSKLKMYTLIYLNADKSIMNILHDRIHTIAKNGFIMGTKSSNIIVIETDLSAEEIREKLERGKGLNSQIFVLKFNYIEYAAWVNQENAKNIVSIFGKQ